MDSRSCCEPGFRFSHGAPLWFAISALMWSPYRISDSLFRQPSNSHDSFVVKTIIPQKVGNVKLKIIPVRDSSGFTTVL